MTCKVLDQGIEAAHFGHDLGNGVFMSKDSNTGAVTLCRHPAGDVRAEPDVTITLDADQWTAAIAGSGRIPESRAAREAREQRKAKRAAQPKTKAKRTK